MIVRTSCEYTGHHGPCRAAEILYRVDEVDVNGTAMCQTCATEAWNTGLYSDIGVDEPGPND